MCTVYRTTAMSHTDIFVIAEIIFGASFNTFLPWNAVSTSAKGRAHAHYTDASNICASTKYMCGHLGYKPSIIPFVYFDRVTVFKVL